ncbi:MAG: type IV secretion system DNA-binding domain-containing protein [Anaerolineaceae bacterium]|nr:type IV secretion system DNA-binding domain-containing protein [Anaerolineaceae bacterium]
MIPESWYREQSTLYLTYPATKLAEMAGLVAAVVNSQLVAHQTYGLSKPLLLVLDSNLASRLPHFAQFLATAADFGIAVILTASSLTALDALTPTDSGATLSAQFAHQLWYAPRDRETAVYIATRYGTRLTSAGEAMPELTPEEILAWPEDQLLLVTERGRPYVVIGQPVQLPEDFPQRQPPLPPAAETVPRRYDQWLPDLPDLTRKMAEFLMANGAIPIPAKDAEGENERDETAVGRDPATKETGAEKTGDDSAGPFTSFSAAAPAKEPEPSTEAEEASEQSLNVARSRYR